MSIVKIEMPCKAPTVVKATVDQMQRTSEAARLLGLAFDFSKTAEGHYFWVSVVNRLHQISQDGILKE